MSFVRSTRFAAVLILLAVTLPATWPQTAAGDTYNLKVVTDASPDYSDMDSLVHSITSRWTTDADKCFALFYWNHIARRQTQPMERQGKPITDPIMQFNDFGYTMCSTISGINCSTWDYMGYKVRYYDLASHTVPEVFYDNGWHMYDNSLSTYYTLCDGKTVASVEDIGKTMACEKSGGKAEPGHIAMYHAVYGTSPNGFLEGADTFRELQHLGQDTFAPKVLKYRSYYNDAERGHRYILNLRENETYTRDYARLDEAPKGAKGSGDPAYFIANGTNKDGTPRDPESPNLRYHLRGNGVRVFEPTLAGAQSVQNVKAIDGALQPAAAGQPAEAVFKVEGANVIASLEIAADATKTSADDRIGLAISTTNGVNWKDVYTADAAGSSKVDPKLIAEVNGAYEVLVRVQMLAKTKPGDVQIKNLKFTAITEINAKTQPQLKLGANTIYVGAGNPTESIVLWPELYAGHYKEFAVDEKNVKSDETNEGYHGVFGPADKDADAYVVFKVDAPGDVTRITQGARMYVRDKKGEIRFEHSFDGGKTWLKSYSFADNTAPWDDIHHQVTDTIPAGVRSVLFRYGMTKATLFSVRMEVDHKTAAPTAGPVDVTFNWSERQADYSLVERSHTQKVDHFPATYTINVGGADHPVVNALTVSAAGARGGLVYGYSDQKDAGEKKFIGQWVTYGNNLAQGKPYTATVKSDTQWGAGDPDGKILTDGVVGSSYTGGSAYTKGVLYNKGTDPEVTIDLGQSGSIAAVRAHIHGYPDADAMKGTVKDAIEVFTSADGKTFTPQGHFDFNLRWKDLPVNYMWNDEETFGGYNHLLMLPKPVEARYVKFKITPARKLGITELQVLDGVKTVPFDLKIALPASNERTASATH